MGRVFVGQTSLGEGLWRSTLRAMRIALLLRMIIAGTALAQTGGPYAITASAVAGGGATRRTGGIDALGDTIGQPAAGHLAGGSYVLNAGFWHAASGAPPSPTPITGTRTPSPTGGAIGSPSSSPTPTVPSTIATPTTHTPIGSASPTPTRTVSPTPLRSGSPLPSITPSPTSTPTPARGDANCDGRVGAADVIALIVDVVAGERAPCGLDDVDGNGHVDSSDLAALFPALFGAPDEAAKGSP